jgi:hypothetical protein
MKNILSILILFIFTQCFSQNNENDSIKKHELNEVIITKKKKAIEQKADRTIFNFSEQAHLNSGSLLEGLKKLPGLIISDVAGMLYQGKPLEVFMDGRPLNIYSNELNSFLESMPANAIEKIEIITQPGAEFPATSGGAIINIISSKSAKKHLSATYSNGYSYTNYEKSRHRFNNSVLLNAKNNLFGWQVQIGQNYADGYQKSLFQSPSTILSENIIDRQNRFYFIKTGLKFDLKKDRILLNYDLSKNDNNSSIIASGFGFTANDINKNKRYRQDFNLVYQKRFDDITKNLDFKFNYNNNKNDVVLNSRQNNNLILDNNLDQNFYQFKTDYNQEIKFLEETKFSTGILADYLDFKTYNFQTKNLDYQRSTLAAYTEFQSKYKNFDFILGGRLESYNIEGKTDTNDLTPFNLTKFFPNATIQYNITSQIFVNGNFNQKISLPNTSALNPNNTNYENPNVSFFGNPNLNPTLFDNYEIKASAFEYFYISYSISEAKNQVTNRIVSTTNGASSVTENIPEIKIENFNFGLPIPYMLFTKGLKKTLEFDFNPDEINFLYFFAGYQKHHIPNSNPNGFWNFNIMSQIILPKKINFTATYNTSTTGGNYYYYNIYKPLNHEVTITLSKKFLSDNLAISLYVNDLFNTNNQEFGAIGTDLTYSSKNDTRRIGISLNYKLPTKNKSAKEQDLFLNEENNNTNQETIK